MYLVQNVFIQGKVSRTISLNTNYLILSLRHRMWSRMWRNVTLLESMYESSPRVRRVIVADANRDWINALCEINVLRGQIPLTDKQFVLLKKKKNLIRLVADKKIRLNKKEKRLNQTGGFLLPLLL